MKRCYACKTEFDNESFHRDRTKKDGLSNRCKACQALKMKKYFTSPTGAEAKDRSKEKYSRSEKGRETINAAHRRYRDTEGARDVAREYRKKFYKTPVGVEYLKRKKVRKVSSGRNAVHLRVLHAVKTGRLKRLPCEVCGKEPAEGHHDDYSKPLDVRWLCKPHHDDHHRQEIRKKRA